jgi:hypothetical protein
MRTTVSAPGDAESGCSALSEPQHPAPTASRTLMLVDIRIGIANSPREIAFESAQTSAEVEKIVSAALDADAKFIKLSDDKGKVYIVPTASFSYLEVGSEKSRSVGFVA